MFELKATDENIENSLITNSLDRNKTVFQFLKILYSLKEQYSLCIDGNWGIGELGKHFLLNNVLELYNY